MTDATDTTIHYGSHQGTLTENCVMEHVALEYLRAQGIMDVSRLLALKTDRPGCTAPWITSAAQNMNDRLGDADRQRLGALIPRLLHDARTPADPEKRRRVAVRVSCWAARSVLHLIRDEHRHEVALRAIQTAEAWLRGEATSATADAAAAAATYAADADADATAYAATAAAAYAYAAVADATAYAATAAAAVADIDPVLWLDDLLDAHVKGLGEEGLLGDEDAFEVWAVESCPV